MADSSCGGSWNHIQACAVSTLALELKKKSYDDEYTENQNYDSHARPEGYFMFEQRPKRDKYK